MGFLGQEFAVHRLKKKVIAHREGEGNRQVRFFWPGPGKGNRRKKEQLARKIGSGCPE
jgi:hypothetical protein